MPQVVISVKTVLIIIIVIYILAHIALYYGTGFNLVAETIKFFGWLFDGLRWVLDQLRGLMG